jgi:nucleoside-diphosphate-sugar epimerase
MHFFNTFRGSVLLQIKKYKFKSFVFISTSSVRLKRQTTYSRCKKAAEEILLSMMEKYDLPICIIRPFSITGVGEQSEHLIPVLIDAAYTGKEVDFTPEPTHDFIDVEDVVEGIINLSEHSARGVFELGTGIKTTNFEVLELVEKITEKKVKARFIDNLRPYDNKDWVSTNFKSRSYGWLPKKTLEQSITEMVDAYRRGREEN